MSGQSATKFAVDLERFPLLECMHVYKGTIHHAGSPPDILDNLDKLDIREGDWIVSTYPKSGTTWMQEIVHLIGTEGNTVEADTKDIMDRVPYMECTSGFYKVSALPSPRVFKTHLTVGMIPRRVWDNNVKIIHVLRNPKDVAVSLYHFYRASTMLGNFNGGWDKFLEMFMAGNVMYGSWFPFVKDWYKKCRDYKNVFFLSYEQLKAKPRAMIGKIAVFLGKDLSKAVLDKIVARTTFEVMKDNQNINYTLDTTTLNHVSPFMRKGEVGDWRSHFKQDQNYQFDYLYQTEMVEYDEITNYVT